MLEAKAKDQGHKRKCSPPPKKKVFTKIFQAISKKKRFLKNFSSAPQNFNNSKNTAVLEPRTGQFLRTWGLEAKDLTFEAKAKDFKICPRGQGRPRGLHLCYLQYFLANCDRKNPISDLVGYLTTACKQAMLRNCSRRLRPVATFRELSMTSNFGCFASLHVASRPV